MLSVGRRGLATLRPRAQRKISTKSTSSAAKSGSLNPPKPLFPQDVAETGTSVFTALSSAKRNMEFDFTKRSIEAKLEKLSPKVKKLMERSDIENLTREERDVVADWMTLNQNLHTYRRRKFLAESTTKIQATRRPAKSQWEEMKESLEEDVERWRATHLPGGTRAQLWSQEFKYRQAEEFSRTTHRMVLAERSLNPNKVSKEDTRLHHLEPAFPPSYQARAANALKLEKKAFDKADNARLERLIERHDMENPLDLTLSRLSRTSRRYFSSSRPICSQIPTTPTPTPSGPSGTPTPAEADTIVTKFRAWFAKNGPLGVALFLTYSTIDLSIIYLILSTGVDVSSLLAYVGIEKGAGAATFAVAYALHKMLAPARAGLVIVTMPYVKPYWDMMVTKFERSELAKDINEAVEERAAAKSAKKP